MSLDSTRAVDRQPLLYKYKESLTAKNMEISTSEATNRIEIRHFFREAESDSQDSSLLDGAFISN